MRGLIATCVLLTLPVSGWAFGSNERMSVHQVDAALFEVVARRATDARQIWCAAGEFARTTLGARGGARLYLVRGPGPSVTETGRVSVQFTLEPNAVGLRPVAPALSLTVDLPGDNLRVGQALNYCMTSQGGL